MFSIPQWPKKRWGPLVLILTVISLGASAACCTQACRRQHETAYRSILASYSEVLKVGMTRKEVETYLEANSKPFRRTCCVPEWRIGNTVLDDIVKIGKERAPFYCREHNVYVGFEFISAGSHTRPEAHDSDTLKRISIVHRLEGRL